MKTISPQTQIAVVVLFLLVPGFVVLLWGLRGVRLAGASEKWPTIKGMIVRSYVAERRPNERRSLVRARVEYSYAVKGTNYTGHRVAFGNHAMSASKAQATVSRYPTGNSVPIYYCPDKPALSVLEPGITSQAWAVPGIGLGIVLLGSACILFGYLRRPGTSRAAEATVREVK